MPNNYLYYNTSDSSYTFSLINKTVSTNKRTRIYLGDTTNEIYTDASSQLKITSNVELQQSLKVTQDLRADGQLSIGYSSSPSVNYNILAKNNKVAINKSDVSATYTLDVGGSIKAGTDLYVSGETTLAGAFNTNGNFNVNTDKFQVNATTGNATVSNDLTVNGNTYLGNQTTDTVTIAGDLTVNGNLLGRVPLGSIIPLMTGYFINPTGGVNTGNTGTYTSVSSLIPTSGAITNDGFLLCDGALIPITANSLLASISGGQQRYTPDLTDSRFLQGSTSSGSISIIDGANNGDNTVILSSSHIPNHTHTINHTHTGSSGDAGSHYHNILLAVGLGGGGSVSVPGGTLMFNLSQIVAGGTTANWIDGTYLTSNISNHNHSITVSSHSGSSGSFGGSTSFNIRPKFINVIYVMRVR